MKKLATSQPNVSQILFRNGGESSPSDPAGGKPKRFMPWNRLAFRLVGLTATVLAPCVVLAVMVCRLPEPTWRWWLSESGPVELASGWGYVLLAVGLLAVGAIRLGKQIGRRRKDIEPAAASNPSKELYGTPLTPAARGEREPMVPLRGQESRFRMGSELTWHPMLLGSCAAVLAAREFDWHNIWTTEGVLKTRFYVDPAISVEEKLAAAAVLCLIGFLLGTTIRAYASTFLDQLRRGQKAAWLAATGIAILPISKMLDSGPRIFKPFLPDESANLRQVLVSAEEIMELAIPTLFLMAAIAIMWPRRRSETPCLDADQQEVDRQPRRAA